jgi:oxygen-independent coproporphyrinogen-3 oxidase
MLKHLYVHIPFCHRICPYCSFHKHLPGDTDTGRFVDALLRELDFHKRTHDITPSTIYLGGGTPTFLSRTHLARLLNGLPSENTIEFGIEANPATFGPEKAALIRETGVNRISLGIQSFDSKTLNTLGRDHSPEQAKEAYQILRAAGFPSVNIDLMFAIPGQSLATWLDTLEQSISLSPDHISAYNLNYEEDTEFFEKLATGEFQQDPDFDADFFTEASARLQDADFRHYEISNFARPGRESQHNQAYWAGNDYLGLGPGAVSTVNGIRWKNVADTNLYIQLMEREGPSAAAREIEHLTEADTRLERIALLLRTAKGAPLTLLENQESQLEQLVTEDLITIENNHAILTHKGKPLADEITASLI